MTISAKQILELLRAESSIGGNRAHRVCVDGVMAGDGQSHMSVGHDDMLALSQDHKTGLFESMDSLVLADAGYLRHGVRR
jgi:hypothetical protein